MPCRPNRPTARTWSTARAFCSSHPPRSAYLRKPRSPPDVPGPTHRSRLAPPDRYVRECSSPHRSKHLHALPSSPRWERVRPHRGRHGSGRIGSDREAMFECAPDGTGPASPSFGGSDFDPGATRHAAPADTRGLCSRSSRMTPRSAGRTHLPIRPPRRRHRSGIIDRGRPDRSRSRHRPLVRAARPTRGASRTERPCSGGWP